MSHNNVPGSIGVWRNVIVQWFLKETKLPWLVMLDDDMIPVVDTQALLQSPADITGCHVIGRGGSHVHGHNDGHIGAGAMKISRHALETIRKPWFRIVDAQDGLSIAQCECGFFCEKARRFGFHPVKAGRIGHRVPVILLPSENDPTKSVLKFDSDPQFKRRFHGQGMSPQRADPCRVRGEIGTD